MLTQQGFTIEGKPKDKIGSFIFEKNDLFIIISLTENDNTPLKPLAKTIWENAQKIPFSAPAGEIKEFLKNISSLSTDVKIEILIGKRIDNILYAGISGSFFLFIKRGGTTYPLFEPVIKAKTVSGYLKEGDLLIAATSAGKAVLDAEAEIPADLTIFTQQLSDKVHAEESGQAAIIFWQVASGESQGQPVQQVIEVQEEDAPQAKEPSKIFGFFINLFTKINLKLIKFLASLLVLIILAVIIFNIVSGLIKSARARVEEETRKITLIADKLKNANELLNLNNVRSGDLANQALSEIKKINLDKLASSDNRKKLEELKAQLEKLVKQSSQVLETKAQLVYSTTLLKKNSAASEIVINNNQAEILDKRQNLVYDVNFETKKAESFDIGKYAKKPLSLASYNDYVFVLDEEAIVQIALPDKKIKTALKKDQEWRQIASFAIYSGNLYLLDPSSSQIWKYSSNDGGFSTIKKYFATSSDLKQAVSFSIDSAVYILFKDGKIEKYLSGEKQAFDMKIPNSSLKNPVKIVTNENLDNVYVLEPTAKRIVILDKKGKYISQIVDNKLVAAKTFGVNEKEKTIFFPVTSEIFKISY